MARMKYGPYGPIVGKIGLTVTCEKVFPLSE